MVRRIQQILIAGIRVYRSDKGPFYSPEFIQDHDQWRYIVGCTGGIGNNYVIPVNNMIIDAQYDIFDILAFLPGGSGYNDFPRTGWGNVTERFRPCHKFPGRFDHHIDSELLPG